jgi:hypothetical protein
MDLPEYPRRRNRSSNYGSAQSSPVLSIVSARTAPEHQETTGHEPHGDVTLGFVDIYQSLSPRQVGVIGLSRSLHLSHGPTDLCLQRLGQPLAQV